MSVSCETPAMVEAFMKSRPPTLGPQEDAPFLYVYRDVLEEIRFNVTYREGKVAAGLLVGKHFQDEAGGAHYVEVSGYVGGTHLSEIAEFTRYLRTQWKAAAAAQRYHFPQDEIVGWYLGDWTTDEKPGQDAVVLHHTFFAHPWQTGLWMSAKDGPRALRTENASFAETAAALIDSGHSE